MTIIWSFSFVKLFTMHKNYTIAQENVEFFLRVTFVALPRRAHHEDVFDVDPVGEKVGVKVVFSMA